MFRNIGIFDTTILIVILLIIDTHADDECKKIKKNDYELYGTKTDYEYARQYINKKDEKELPKSFDDDSLEEEHEDLLKDSCRPVVFYFIGRHAARFPDGEDIELYNKKLSELKDVLKKQEVLGKCRLRYEPYLNWTSKLVPKHDNLMTETGARQERDIARRFKKLYPEFFNTKTSDITIGVTTKLRAAQTGAEFLKEVESLNLRDCDASSLPSNDLEQQNYSIDKILTHPCYKELMDNFTLPFLEFHKQCDKIGGKQKVDDPLLEKLDNPDLVREVARRVSKKLGLPETATVDAETLDSIFSMCKFENAFKDHSPWCDLFEKKDVDFIEYMKDIEIYIKNAYGPNANSRQSCPLIKDLVENFEKGTKLVGEPNEKRKSYFYFSHAGPMKKILASFNVFKDDDSYTMERVNDFVNKLKVDKEREWQSSLIVPFSANMVFVMYRCQKPGKEIKHKILATVTERPVKLGSCKDTQCSSNKFFETYKSMKDCDLNKICRRG